MQPGPEISMPKAMAKLLNLQKNFRVEKMKKDGTYKAPKHSGWKGPKPEKPAEASEPADDDSVYTIDTDVTERSCYAFSEKSLVLDSPEEAGDKDRVKVKNTDKHECKDKVPQEGMRKKGLGGDKEKDSGHDGGKKRPKSPDHPPPSWVKKQQTKRVPPPPPPKPAVPPAPWFPPVPPPPVRPDWHKEAPPAEPQPMRETSKLGSSAKQVPCIPKAKATVCLRDVHA